MAKYRYSKSVSPFDEVKNTYILIGICAAVVVIALVLCITMQSCADGSTDDIPVVEQGDGVEEQPDYSEGLTSIGDIIIDDGGTPVDEFTVTVTGADGRYQRSAEEGSEASLDISGQNAESFSFSLTIGEAQMSGTAYFNGERTAICEKADGALSFAFDAGAVYVAPDGTISELGDASAEGLYALIEAAPTTSTESTEPTTTTTAAKASGVYDLDVIYSDAVQSALGSMMPASDRALIDSLMALFGEYGLIFGSGDASMEKEGRAFNYDSQMDAVVYYAFESGTGREVVVLCSSNGKTYAGVCDGSEYRYYTNDSNRESPSDAPDYIVRYAKVKGMSLS